LSDRRGTVRVDVDLSVTVLQATTTSHVTVASNLCEAGMFIHELVPFEIGTPVMLMFRLPGMLRPIQCNGEVMHKRDHFLEGMPDRPIGNGVRFVSLAVADRVRIARYVDKLS